MPTALSYIQHTHTTFRKPTQIYIYCLIHVNSGSTMSPLGYRLPTSWDTYKNSNSLSTLIDKLLHEYIRRLIWLSSISRNAGDKIRRSFNYLLHQRSFYPLNPPPEDVAVDSELVKNHANLDFVPNVMILPSSMKCFIRVRAFSLNRKFSFFYDINCYLSRLYSGFEQLFGAKSGPADHVWFGEYARHIRKTGHHTYRRLQNAE